MAKLSEEELQAIEAVQDLRAFINTEAQVIEAEHDTDNGLIGKLYSWDYIVQHLMEEDAPHELIFEVGMVLIEIRDIVESQNIQILKEETKLLDKLENDVAHRDWRAVKEDEKKEAEIIRLRVEELRTLHSKFIEAMKLMKRSGKIDLEQNLKRPTKKKDYYLVELYKFLRAYERIFRHLWMKEKEIKK